MPDNNDDKRQDWRVHDHKFGTDPNCPSCNALAVMAHFMVDGDHIQSIDNSPLTFTTGANTENTICTVDFGVMAHAGSSAACIEVIK